jgi:N4-gp56 family major capsid protein
MSQTNVASGSGLALTQYSVALTAQYITAPTDINLMTGPAPQQKDAEALLKQQTSQSMPFVRVTELADLKGDKVTMDAFNVVGGMPIMGDRNAEGKGQKLSSSSMDLKIDLATFNVDAGGKMSRQRTRHDLRKIAMANLDGYWARVVWQRALIHCAGARGSQVGQRWDIGLTSHPDFAETLINPVLAPTYNRHLVVDGGTVIRGGAQLLNIDTTDVWKLSVLDDIANMLDAQETKIQPIKVNGDKMADTSQIRAVLLLPPNSYNSLLTDMTAGNNLRNFQSLALERAKIAGNHPIFLGEVGIWRGILVRKIDYTIMHNPGDSFQYVPVANRLLATGNETAGTIPALGANWQVERGVLLGAQALARAEGPSNSGVQASIIENPYNARRSFEYISEFMGGEAKLRFRFKNENGDPEPTDNGVYVIDAVTAKRAG